MIYEGPVVDTDVHHRWSSDGELLEYFSAPWRRYMEESRQGIQPAVISYPHTFGTNKRLDSYPESGLPPGSDYDTMRRQLLDPFRVERAILTFDVGHEPLHPNPYLGTELARAANDWSIERWLDSGDNRLYGAVLVAPQIPELAASEVRRTGRHPRMVEVLVVANALGQPFGHPVYHPIYEAAQELGLPIALHPGGDLAGIVHTTAGGLANTRLEYYTLLNHPGVHHLVSFFSHGVFEKFPELRLMVLEAGVNWLPWLAWSLEGMFDDLRRERPDLRRRPAELLRERVRLGTQPIESGERPGQLQRLLESFEGFEKLLCFATDYPHWDADEPAFTAAKLPRAWLPGVFRENAWDFYRWGSPPAVEPAPERRVS